MRLLQADTAPRVLTDLLSARKRHGKVQKCSRRGRSKSNDRQRRIPGPHLLLSASPARHPPHLLAVSANLLLGLLMPTQIPQAMRDL